MDWTKEFSLKNVSNGRLVTGPISVLNQDEVIIEPHRYPDKVIESLKKFHALGKIEVSNNVKLDPKKSSPTSTKKVTTTKNEHGDKNEHIVYNPINEKGPIILGDAMTINEGKSIKVSDITEDISGTIQVEFTELDRIEAREFLAQHWKRVETEVNKITSKRKLKFYLEVASQDNIADKKIEAIKERLGQL